MWYNGGMSSLIVFANTPVQQPWVPDWWRSHRFYRSVVCAVSAGNRFQPTMPSKSIGAKHINPTPSHPHPRPRRNDEQFRQHALHGMPTCKHCLRSFHGWPEFSGHFRGSACPILHSDPPGSPHHELSRPLAKGASAPERTEEATTEPLPLFQRTDLQQLAANKQLKELASAIRTSKRLQFCPECGQWCTKPSYLSRRANQIHPHMAMHHKAICSWAQRKTRLSQPCEWCGETYGTRQATHLQSCPVLWMCGHFFQRHASIDDTGQSSLAAAFKHGRTLDGQGRTSPSQAEFEQFGLYMKKATQATDPTGTPLTSTPASSIAPPTQEDMDLDREKRPVDLPQPLEQPAKWAKGEAKGETKPELAPPQQSGKGSSGDVLAKAAAAPPPPDGTDNSGSLSGQPAPPTQASQAPTPANPPHQRAHADQMVPKTSSQGGWGGWRGNGGRNWGFNQGRSQDRDRDRRGRDEGRWNQSDRDKDREMEELREMIRHLARLALRLEDAMSICNLDNEFILFFQTSSNPWSITSPLYTTATQWKAKKESDPTSLSQPLRSVLFYCVWASLLPQLRKMEEATEEEFIKEVKSRGLTEENSWLYLKWDNQAKKHQKDTQEPLEHVTAVQLVQQIMMLCTYPDTIGRFHALRPLTSNLTSDVIPFMLTLQNRTQESHQLYTCVRRLCRNSCTHLVGMTLRPSRLGRSPLAQQIDRLLKHI